MPRATGLLFVALAVILPMVGVVLAVVRFSQGEQREAGRLLAAAVLGAFVYLLLLG